MDTDSTKEDTNEVSHVESPAAIDGTSQENGAGTIFYLNYVSAFARPLSKNRGKQCVFGGFFPIVALYNIAL